jgi:hypothetical protein
MTYDRPISVVVTLALCHAGLLRGQLHPPAPRRLLEAILAPFGGRSMQNHAAELRNITTRSTNRGVLFTLYK